MEKEVIAVKQTDQIEVFMNENGGITIKQCNGYGEEAVVAFWAENVESIIAALHSAKSDVQSAEEAAASED